MNKFDYDFNYEFKFDTELNGMDQVKEIIVHMLFTIQNNIDTDYIIENLIDNVYDIYDTFDNFSCFNDTNNMDISHIKSIVDNWYADLINYESFAISKIENQILILLGLSHNKW